MNTEKDMRHYFNILAFAVISVVSSCEHYQRQLYTDSPHIAALVLARGGSKAIRLKNIRTVGGRTLLGHTLDEINALGFDSVWVSTDHGLIYDEARKSNVNVHWRKWDTATDEASSLFATQEFLKQHPAVDIVALVQCTSPFLRKEYLEQAKTAIEKFECVFSVTRSFELLWQRANGILCPLNFDLKNRPRRQDLPEQFVENGMFYFASRKMIENGQFQRNNCAIVEIPRYNSMEIDEPLDLIVANMLSQLEL